MDLPVAPSPSFNRPVVNVRNARTAPIEVMGPADRAGHQVRHMQQAMTARMQATPRAAPTDTPFDIRRKAAEDRASGVSPHGAETAPAAAHQALLEHHFYQHPVHTVGGAAHVEINGMLHPVHELGYSNAPGRAGVIEVGATEDTPGTMIGGFVSGDTFHMPKEAPEPPSVRGFKPVGSGFRDPNAPMVQPVTPAQQQEIEAERAELQPPGSVTTPTATSTTPWKRTHSSTASGDAPASSGRVFNRVLHDPGYAEQQALRGNPVEKSYDRKNDPFAPPVRDISPREKWMLHVAVEGAGAVIDGDVPGALGTGPGTGADKWNRGVIDTVSKMASKLHPTGPALHPDLATLAGGDLDKWHDLAHTLWKGTNHASIAIPTFLNRMAVLKNSMAITSHMEATGEFPLHDPHVLKGVAASVVRDVGRSRDPRVVTRKSKPSLTGRILELDEHDPAFLEAATQPSPVRTAANRGDSGGEEEHGFISSVTGRVRGEGGSSSNVRSTGDVVDPNAISEAAIAEGSQKGEAELATAGEREAGTEAKQQTTRVSGGRTVTTDAGTVSGRSRRAKQLKARTDSAAQAIVRSRVGMSLDQAVATAGMTMDDFNDLIDEHGVDTAIKSTIGSTPPNEIVNSAFDFSHPIATTRLGAHIRKWASNAWIEQNQQSNINTPTSNNRNQPPPPEPTDARHVAEDRFAAVGEGQRRSYYDKVYGATTMHDHFSPEEIQRLERVGWNERVAHATRSDLSDNTFTTLTPMQTEMLKRHRQRLNIEEAGTEMLVSEPVAPSEGNAPRELRLTRSRAATVQARTKLLNERTRLGQQAAEFRQKFGPQLRRKIAERDPSVIEWGKAMRELVQLPEDEVSQAHLDRANELHNALATMLLGNESEAYRTLGGAQVRITKNNK